MKKLETILATIIIQSNISKFIKNTELGISSNEEPSIVFEIEGAKDINRKYRSKIIKYLWGPINQVYEAYIAAYMIMEGYMAFPIEGGWIVVSPEGKEYQINEDINECTCEHFTLGKHEGMCKHMTYVKWIINSRARTNQYKLDKDYI